MGRRGGYIKLYRSLSEGTLWTNEKFTRGQAWVDLLMLANFKPGYIRVRGTRLDIARGQVGWSIRRLSLRWRWSRKKTERFLKELENDHQIEPQKNRVSTVLTITNYEHYQKKGPQRLPQRSHRGATEVATEVATDDPLNKKEKNVKKEKEVIQGRVFVKPTLAEVEAYCKERGNKVNPLQWFSYYESNGWRVGRNPMKSWKSAILTWEHNGYGKNTHDPRGVKSAVSEFLSKGETNGD